MEKDVEITEPNGYITIKDTQDKNYDLLITPKGLINWGAYGSVSPERAERYSEMLKVATALAKEIAQKS